MASQSAFRTELKGDLCGNKLRHVNANKISGGPDQSHNTKMYRTKTRQKSLTLNRGNPNAIKFVRILITMHVTETKSFLTL